MKQRDLQTFSYIRHLSKLNKYKTIKIYPSNENVAFHSTKYIYIDTEWINCKFLNFQLFRCCCVLVLNVLEIGSYVAQRITFVHSIHSEGGVYSFGTRMHVLVCLCLYKFQIYVLHSD